jgi:glyoxylase-like metal-dependent hydrolase (beta-lactamase superfamily II)
LLKEFTMPSRRSVLKATAATLLTAASAAARPNLAFSKAPLKGGQAPGYYRLKVGAYEVTALSDGTVAIPLAKLYANTTVDHAEAALAAAFQGPSSETSVNAYLVNTGERLVLIDAGTGTYLGPTLGRLRTNIEASGYKVEEVDDVILTHIHTDHAEVLPGFGSVLRAGHTPGHSSIVIESQGQKLMFWGDVTHGDVLQFDEPDVAIAFDINQQMAVSARKKAFEHAADGAYLVAGAHIAFPGIGHLRRDDTNYDWVPLNYSL